MHALANRVKLGWGSWLQVLDGIPRFMAENELPPLEHPSIWDQNFVRMLQMVDGIFDGSVPDASNSALYWGDLNNIQRAWFSENIIMAPHPIHANMRHHQRVKDMNSLSFWA